MMKFEITSFNADVLILEQFKVVNNIKEFAADVNNISSVNDISSVNNIPSVNDISSVNNISSVNDISCVNDISSVNDISIVNNISSVKNMLVLIERSSGHFIIGSLLICSHFRDLAAAQWKSLL